MSRVLPRIACGLLAAVLCAFVPAPQEARSARAAQAASEARAALAEGRAEDAWKRALVGLEHAAHDFELLDLAARAAQAAGKSDEALWYTSLALDSQGAQAKERAAQVEALRTAKSALDPLGAKAEAIEAEYATALLAAASDLARRKQFVSAVGFLARLDDGPLAEKAEVELNRIFDNKKAVDVLLDSGLDVPVKKRDKRSPEVIAREDKKHQEWKSAHEIKGEQYTVRTNLGGELAGSISLAMEQMNAFYRRFFNVKQRGGDTARVSLCIYKTRAEFDEHEKDDKGKPPDPNVAGFFSPSELRVVTYDPRDEGQALSELWSTLFHEASHQFTHLALTGGDFPTWLNEGTASYFEGARLLPNGKVESNLVAESRLEALAVYIEESKLSLRQVVTYKQPGSYPGEYYPYGWGLVYFFHNFENEKSERVYLQPYRDFLATYKSGGKHDVLGRFVEHFVTKAKQPGVTTFEEFEARFNQWIGELNRLHFGGAEVADELFASAKRQRAAKQDEAAAETLAQALRKRPGDAVMLLELSELLSAQKKTDAAFYNTRLALEALRAEPDVEAKLSGDGGPSVKELLEACAQRGAKLDRAASEVLAAADSRFSASAVEVAQAYVEKDLPRVGLRLLERGMALHGRASSFAAAASAIRADTGADLRRWRALPVDAGLEAWYVDEEWSGDGEAIVCTSSEDGPRFATSNVAFEPGARFEAVIDASGLDKDSGMCGFVFGMGGAALQVFGYSATGTGLIAKVGDADLVPRKAKLPLLKADKLRAFTLSVELRERDAEFFVDGKSVAEISYAEGELDGEVGLMVQSGTVRFSGLRVLD